MKKTLEEIKEILDKHRDELRDKYKITEIGVFGSYVRGEQKKKSDIDILATFGEEVSLLDLVGAELYLKKILKMKVDLVPKEDLRPELKDRILKETVLVKKDIPVLKPQIKKVLEDMKSSKMLAQLGGDEKELKTIPRRRTR
ncbi:MAG: nucleotidyltransferase family protein [Nitrospirae bacterium]|nr:nucleotidyltransferase family protein [Nitrospirota bacterium]